jgi:pimeloyl-ACP methyl ester carboxylesterase
VAQPRGQFMDIDGQRIHYVDTGGSKPPVVLIHGLGGNLLHFGYAMADKLAKRFSRHPRRPSRPPATRPAGRRTGDADRTGVRRLRR